MAKCYDTTDTKAISESVKLVMRHLSHVKKISKMLGTSTDTETLLIPVEAEKEEDEEEEEDEIIKECEDDDMSD